jgi:hypothetical protein
MAALFAFARTQLPNGFHEKSSELRGDPRELNIRSFI